ncbi:hypothetical protein V6N13_102245 [Hibiscus sabdariffa]|uniref:Uncharacterized protein n=2 Tax=Hibiscus sabdariffa TaxID=183260 RepID=A0ABR1ZCD5_9ROSI
MDLCFPDNYNENRCVLSGQGTDDAVGTIRRRSIRNAEPDPQLETPTARRCQISCMASASSHYWLSSSFVIIQPTFGYLVFISDTHPDMNLSIRPSVKTITRGYSRQLNNTERTSYHISIYSFLVSVTSNEELHRVLTNCNCKVQMINPCNKVTP